VKVLLVVIDAASPRVVNPAIQTGQLRNLKRIADAGAMHDGSITIFPSITPAATTSIVTGTYPAENGIAGASWYVPERREVVYYGDDFWVIAKKGFGAFLRDFLVRLNGDRLKAPTMFEMIESAGRRAACVNYLVYRGNVQHRVNVPWLLAMLPGVPLTESVQGPTMLCLGDFVTTHTLRGKVDGPGGLLHRFGMDDAATATMLSELAADGELGDFTLAYFADNDYRSHEVGPHEALPVVERVDEALGKVFDAAGGFDRFIQETTVIVTSDHGHCEILPDADQSVVHLDSVLGEFRQADLGSAWKEADEVMICPNMRAAEVHLQNRSAVLRDRVVRTVLSDPRVDLALWRDRNEGTADRPYVVESPRGRLEFWRAADRAGMANDEFGTAWSWQGEPSALQLDVQQGIVRSVEYPNAFERIAGALDASDSGDIWLTARPGCEFNVTGGKAHVGGGSHGALHALDSSSIAVIGGPGAPSLPATLRSVDIAPMCMELLELPMRYRVGDARPS
jgi:hypothetical protein